MTRDINKLELISETEKRKILLEFNNTSEAFPEDKTIQELIEEQVSKKPEQIAVDTGINSITYGQLNKKANQMARLLRDNGVGRNVLVGIYLKRSEGMIVAVLAILKAGGAYVPLDTNFPKARLEQLVRSVKYVITSTELEQQIKSIQQETNVMIFSEAENYTAENLAINNSAEDLAYVIFTSGTSGIPKGVTMTHGPAINVIDWVNKTFQVNSADKLLFITSLSFDLSVYDILGILAAGATIRLASEEEIGTPSLILEIINDEQISFWDSTPATFAQLLPFMETKKAQNTSLRLVFLSGDRIPLTLADKIREVFVNAQIIALGGATEAAIWSNYFPINNIEKDWIGIPYGKPIQNAHYYILDNELHLCPIGVPGDLYIGGKCLAKGYWNDSQLTTEKFINNPYVQGEIIYKTGDMARWWPDGNMEFLGRQDSQIKLRGYRIECKDIENATLKQEQIKEALVVTVKSNLQEVERLCLFVVTSADIGADEIRQKLLYELPEYMVPAKIVVLEKIPLTLTGKIDRQFLEKMAIEYDSVKAVGYKPPQTETEQILANIWQQVFTREKVGINDDFFELGGDSLNGIRIIAKMEEKGLYCNLADIYYYRNIRLLSDYLTSINPSSKSKNKVEIKIKDQMESVPQILASIRAQETEYFNSIISGNVVKEYSNPVLPMLLKDHIRQMYWASFILFKDNFNVNLLKKALLRLLKEQGLLRCVLINENEFCGWREFETPENISIPYIDLSMYGEDTIADFLKNVLSTYYQKNDRFKNFPFRVLLLKANSRETYLIYLLSEAIDDQYGEDIVRHSILNDYYAVSPKNISTLIKGYDEYFQILKYGPRGISSEDISKKFELQKMAEASEQLRKNVQQKILDGQSRFLFDITLPAMFDGDKWETGISLLQQFCQKYVNISNLPVWILHDCRNFQDGSFLNTVGGDFIDYVPAVLNLDQKTAREQANYFKQQLDLASAYQLNFFHLFMNDNFSEKFGGVRKLLQSCIGDVNSSRSIFLYRFNAHFDDIKSYEVIDQHQYFDINQYPDYLTRYGRGFYFYINFRQNIIHLELHVPFQIEEQALRAFFTDAVEKLQEHSKP
ncbi:MAG: non-ribosomal peptide synthetase [Candidatus Margulisbacteria bacterium]|nr:non-ribosomal peptide synthetase [Candidatus Margulisiibacteriota bacterium]